MILPTDFNLHRILVSGFISRDELRPSAVLRQALRDWGDVYDGDSVSIPLPSDLPPEIPSVILSSQDQTYTLEVARARVNLAWTRGSQATADLDGILSTFADRLVNIAQKQGVVIGRLGAVVMRVIECSEPGVTLAKKYCRDEWLKGPLNRPEGFEIHAHKVFALLPDVRVNSWIRIRSAKAGGDQYSYVTVEQDINTLTGEFGSHSFSKDELISWFQQAGNEFNNVLVLYFPSYQVD